MSLTTVNTVAFSPEGADLVASAITTRIHWLERSWNTEVGAAKNAEALYQRTGNPRWEKKLDDHHTRALEYADKIATLGEIFDALQAIARA